MGQGQDMRGGPRMYSKGHRCVSYTIHAPFLFAKGGKITTFRTSDGLLRTFSQNLCTPDGPAYKGNCETPVFFPGELTFLTAGDRFYLGTPAKQSVVN